MSHETLVSYAQNGEDVVLWRTLGHVTRGRYLDVGACDPDDLSVTKVLYDRGWRGIDIDAVPEYVDRFRIKRPGNEAVHAAVTDHPGGEIILHELIGTGLSTLAGDTAARHEAAGYERRDIIVPTARLDEVCERSALLEGQLHLLKIDVEGAETEVLRSFDLERWRPWVVVVEATRPLSTEASWQEWDPILVEAGWVFTLFDGVSRFYVSPDHPELQAPASYPACVLDDYIPVRWYRQDLRVAELAADVELTRGQALRWRSQAVAYWANGVARAQAGADEARAARSERDRALRRTRELRERLVRARGDRARMRARIQRMSRRIERLERGQTTPPPRISLARRLRARVRRAARR